MTATRIQLHPLFLMKLVHMIRIGRIKEAIALGGNEVRIALERAQENEGDQDQEGGIIVVPSPERLSALDLAHTSDDLSQTKGLKP
jgi:hypothetical protein